MIRDAMEINRFLYLADTILQWATPQASAHRTLQKMKRLIVYFVTFFFVTAPAGRNNLRSRVLFIVWGVGANVGGMGKPDTRVVCPCRPSVDYLSKAVLSCDI